MDGFMDKLAQKLNAQEMIKANLAADAEKMRQMQMQVGEYEAALQEMRKLGLKYAENADKFNILLDGVNQKIEEITKAGIDKIEASRIEDDKIAQVEARLKELKELLGTDQKEMNEVSQEIAKKTEKMLQEISKKTEEMSQEISRQTKEASIKIVKQTEEATQKIAKQTEATSQEIVQKVDEMSEKNEEVFHKTEELFKKNEEYIHSEDVKVYRNVQAVVVEEAEKQTEVLTKGQKENGKQIKALVVIGAISMIGILANVVLNLAQLFNWNF